MTITRLPKLRVSIIDQCQLKCSFCGGNDTHMENFQPEEMKNLLDYNQLIKIIKIYIEFGGKYVQFTGGEPLLYPKIIQLVYQIYDMNGIPEINTNGLALSEEMAKKLQESGLNVIKVSIPSFYKDKYKMITGVDALQIVLKNISNAKKYLNIRINTVATQSNKDELDIAIKTCREIGIKQLLFLELLYYYDIKENSKDYFKNEYINILEEMGPLIEKKLNSKINTFDFYNEFENNLMVCKSNDDGFQIFIKQARTTLRINNCLSCKHFCQEGIYELRLSTGGFLSFCNTINSIGKDLSCCSEDDIRKLFKHYLDMFNQGFVEDFQFFKDKHSI